MMRGLVIATNGDMRVQTFTAPALVYGPKYRHLSFFIVLENRTLGNGSSVVTLI